jgi:hypothetical protein
MHISKKRIDRRFGMWWICLSPWTWWWYHGCMQMSKLSKSYILNACKVWVHQLHSIKLLKKKLETSSNFKLYSLFYWNWANILWEIAICQHRARCWGNTGNPGSHSGLGVSIGEDRKHTKQSCDRRLVAMETCSRVHPGMGGGSEL